MTLSQALEEAKIQTELDPNGHLAWSIRIRLWLLIEAICGDETVARRGAMAILEVRETLGRWNRMNLSVATQELPDKFLTIGASFLKGIMTYDEAISKFRALEGCLADAVAECLDLGVSDVLPEAGLAACEWALSERLWNEDLWPSVLSKGLTEFDVEAEDHDVDYLCSIGWSGGIPGDDIATVGQRRRFWLAWLTERIPEAVHNRLDVLLRRV